METRRKHKEITCFQIKKKFHSMSLIWWSPWLLHVLIFLITSQSKKLKALFTYQTVANDAWSDKDDSNGAVTTHAKAGLFEDGGGFWKLGHKFLKPLRDKVAWKHYSSKNNYFFQM